MKVYLSGPMKGNDDFQRLFGNIAEAIRKVPRWECFNPAEKAENVEDATPAEHQRALRGCLRMVISSEVVVALPGWEESRGARLEVFVAAELGIKILFPEQWHPIATTVDLGKYEWKRDEEAIENYPHRVTS